MPNYYESLGIGKESNKRDIIQAYRKLAKIWHPDKNSEPEAVEKFKEISAAYSTLVDSAQRHNYDELLREHKGNHDEVIQIMNRSRSSATESAEETEVIPFPKAFGIPDLTSRNYNALGDVEKDAFILGLLNLGRGGGVSTILQGGEINDIEVDKLPGDALADISKRLKEDTKDFFKYNLNYELLGGLITFCLVEQEDNLQHSSTYTSTSSSPLFYPEEEIKRDSKKEFKSLADHSPVASPSISTPLDKNLQELFTYNYAESKKGIDQDKTKEFVLALLAIPDESIRTRILLQQYLHELTSPKLSEKGKLKKLGRLQESLGTGSLTDMGRRHREYAKKPYFKDVLASIKQIVAMPEWLTLLNQPFDKLTDENNKTLFMLSVLHLVNTPSLDKTHQTVIDAQDIPGKAALLKELLRNSQNGAHSPDAYAVVINHLTQELLKTEQATREDLLLTLVSHPGIYGHNEVSYKAVIEQLATQSPDITAALYQKPYNEFTVNEQKLFDIILLYSSTSELKFSLIQHGVETGASIEDLRIRMNSLEHLESKSIAAYYDAYSQASFEHYDTTSTFSINNTATLTKVLYEPSQLVRLDWLNQQSELKSIQNDLVEFKANLTVSEIATALQPKFTQLEKELAVVIATPTLLSTRFAELPAEPKLERAQYCYALLKATEEERAGILQGCVESDRAAIHEFMTKNALTFQFNRYLVYDTVKEQLASAHYKTEPLNSETTTIKPDLTEPEQSLPQTPGDLQPLLSAEQETTPKQLGTAENSWQRNAGKRNAIIIGLGGVAIGLGFAVDAAVTHDTKEMAGFFTNTVDIDIIDMPVYGIVIASVLLTVLALTAIAYKNRPTADASSIANEEDPANNPRNT